MTFVWIVFTLMTGFFTGCQKMNYGDLFEQREAEVEVVLKSSWIGYKKRFITTEGRVVRPKAGGDTVSEGQAYAMLRAVWMDDQKTFDQCYQWTELHLSRNEKMKDHLLAWRWKEGEIKDITAASDADLDYAFALLLAERKWGNPSRSFLPAYTEKAKLVLRDIMKLETYRIQQGYLFLLPGTWNVDKTGIVLNISYFSPAWYRVFVQITGDERWMELVESSYFVIQSVMGEIEGIKGVGLVPDWCQINERGELQFSSDFKANHTWDAFRTSWRIFLDWQWYGERRAQKYLEELYRFYKREWEKNQKIFAEYSYVGKPIRDYESPVMYIPFLASSLCVEPRSFLTPYKKLMENFHKNSRGGYFIDSEEYYGNNWVSFGLLLLSPRLQPP